MQSSHMSLFHARWSSMKISSFLSMQEAAYFFLIDGGKGKRPPSSSPGKDSSWLFPPPPSRPKVCFFNIIMVKFELSTLPHEGGKMVRVDQRV